MRNSSRFWTRAVLCSLAGSVALFGCATDDEGPRTSAAAAESTDAIDSEASEGSGEESLAERTSRLETKLAIIDAEPRDEGWASICEAEIRDFATQATEGYSPDQARIERILCNEGVCFIQMFYATGVDNREIEFALFNGMRLAFDRHEGPVGGASRIGGSGRILPVLDDDGVVVGESVYTFSYFGRNGHTAEDYSVAE